MDFPDWQGEIQRGDFGPDTGHYHVYVEQDGYMVPFTGWYSYLDDQLCWATRDGAWRSLGRFRGAAAVVGQTHSWYDCEGNDDTLEKHGLTGR